MSHFEPFEGTDAEMEAYEEGVYDTLERLQELRLTLHRDNVGGDHVGPPTNCPGATREDLSHD